MNFSGFDFSSPEGRKGYFFFAGGGGGMVARFLGETEGN